MNAQTIDFERFRMVEYKVSALDDDTKKIKASIDYHEKFMGILDKRSSMLELSFSHQHEQLDEIKGTLSEATKNLQAISGQFAAHTGINAFKKNVWMVVFSCITAFTALGLHSVLFKSLGLV